MATFAPGGSKSTPTPPAKGAGLGDGLNPGKVGLAPSPVATFKPKAVTGSPVSLRIKAKQAQQAKVVKVVAPTSHPVDPHSIATDKIATEPTFDRATIEKQAQAYAQQAASRRAAVAHLQEQATGGQVDTRPPVAETPYFTGQQPYAHSATGAAVYRRPDLTPHPAAPDIPGSAVSVPAAIGIKPNLAVETLQNIGNGIVPLATINRLRQGEAPSFGSIASDIGTGAAWLGPDQVMAPLRAGAAGISAWRDSHSATEAISAGVGALKEARAAKQLGAQVNLDLKTSQARKDYQATLKAAGYSRQEQRAILTTHDAAAVAMARDLGIKPSDAWERIYASTAYHPVKVTTEDINTGRVVFAQEGAKPEINNLAETPPAHTPEPPSPTFFKNAARRLVSSHADALPPEFNTASKFTKLLVELRNRAIAAADYKNWYANGAQAIMAHTGGDVTEAEKVAGLIAVYSPRAEVYSKTNEWNNLDRALNAYDEYKKTGQVSPTWSISKHLPGEEDWQTTRANQIMQGTFDWNGLKTNRFYRNFLQHINPDKYAQLFGAEKFGTMDTWMRRAFNYPAKHATGPEEQTLLGAYAPAVGKAQEPITPKMYSLMEKATQVVADSLGWSPEEAQAAIWTDIKAESEGTTHSQAGFDFADAFAHRDAKQQFAEQHIPAQTSLDELAPQPKTEAGRVQTIVNDRAGTDLKGLPKSVKFADGKVTFRSNRDIQRIAQEYMDNAHLPYRPPTTYAAVDVKRAEEIARLYDEAQHSPADPATAAAYDAMIRETLAQYKALEAEGYKYEFYPPYDPYPGGPRYSALDITENKHMYVYPTDEGFGTLATETQHPLLADSGVRWNDKPVTHNDLFRAVHDTFGHVKEGVGFRAAGEENAWRSHSAMYSPEARRAMTSETRGQNSWVNYGPHGEANRVASQEGTVYADQKAVLLPEWVSQSGALESRPITAEVASSEYEKALAEAVSMMGRKVPRSGIVGNVQHRREALSWLAYAAQTDPHPDVQRVSDVLDAAVEAMNSPDAEVFFQKDNPLLNIIAKAQGRDLVGRIGDKAAAINERIFPGLKSPEQDQFKLPDESLIPNDGEYTRAPGAVTHTPNGPMGGPTIHMPQAAWSGEDSLKVPMQPGRGGPENNADLQALHGETPAVPIKGAVARTTEGEHLLHLFQGADTSTAIHELAHAVEQYLPAELRAALGNDPETIARSFERYFFEGGIPSEKMRPAMETIANEMATVYAHADAIPGAVMNPEIRQAFDNFFLREAQRDPTFAERVGASWFTQEGQPESTPGAETTHEPRILQYHDLPVQFPSSQSQITRAGQRVWDSQSQKLERFATSLRESKNPLARDAGRAITPFTSRGRAPKQAAKNLLNDIKRVRALNAQAIRSIASVGKRAGLVLGKREGDQLAHFYYAQLPADARNADGLGLVRGSLQHQYEYVTAPDGMIADLHANLDEIQSEIKGLGKDATMKEIGPLLHEQGHVKQQIADIPDLIFDLSRNMAKLDKVIANPPEVNDAALAGIHQLMADRQAILEDANVLDPAMAEERKGLLARHLGLTPDGTEAYVGHRMSLKNRGSTFPRGASFGRTALPQGATTKNELALFRSGRLHQSMDTIMQDWQAAQGYVFHNIAKNDLAKMGEPVEGNVKDGYLLVNPKGQKIPRKIHTSPDEQTISEGFNPADIAEYQQNYLAETSAEQQRMIEQAKEFGNLHELRQVPADVAGKYYERLLGKRLSVSTPGLRTKGVSTALGRGMDIATNSVYMSLIYTNPGYIPSITMQNLVFAAMHQGAFLPTNLSRAGDVLANGPRDIIDFLKNEVGVGAMESIVNGKDDSLAHTFIRHIHTVPDTWPRVAAFLHEAAREGIVGKYGLRMNEKDYAALRDLFTNPDKKPLLRDIADRSIQSQVDFGRLGPTEQALARKILFVWPWIRGAAHYPIRFALDHPLRTIAAGAYIAAGSPGLPVKFQTKNVPSWLEDSIKAGNKRIDGKLYPQVFSTRYVSPISTPYDLAETILAKPGAATISSLANPLIAALWRAGNKENSFGTATKGYIPALESNAASLVPNYGLAKDIISPPKPGTTLYPGDSTPLGRIERALRVFPTPYDPAVALKDRERQGLSGSLVQVHQEQLTTESKQAGLPAPPHDVLIDLSHKTRLDQISAKAKGDEKAKAKAAVAYYAHDTGDHSLDADVKLVLKEGTNADAKQLYEAVRQAMIGPGLKQYESAIKQWKAAQP